MRIATLSLLALVLAASAARAQPIRTFEKVVLAGKSQQIERVIGLDPDCHAAPLAAISLLQEPQQGHVTVEKVQAFPTYPSFNRRSKCNARKVTAQGIFYRAPANALGDDTFIIELVDNLGSPRRVRFHVTIRPPDGPERASPKAPADSRSL